MAFSQRKCATYIWIRCPKTIQYYSKPRRSLSTSYNTKLNSRKGDNAQTQNEGEGDNTHSSKEEPLKCLYPGHIPTSTLQKGEL